MNGRAGRENEMELDMRARATHRGDLEVYDHLPQLGPITEGLIEEFISGTPNPDELKEIGEAGASLSAKTTVSLQLAVKISRDPRTRDWETANNTHLRHYFADTGMMRDIGIHMHAITNEQGGLVNTDYRTITNIGEEVVLLTHEFIRGPGLFHISFVWVTEIENDLGEEVGTTRGGLRVARRMVANRKARLIALATPEELKDIMGEVREQERLSDPRKAKEIADAAGNIHSIQIPELIHAQYMQSSNKATRIQQAHDIALGIWTVLPEARRFETFTDFEAYYFDPGTKAVRRERYPEWEPLVLSHHEEWLEGIFRRPISQIDPSRGAVIENSLLVEEPNEETTPEKDSQPHILVPRHVYDKIFIEGNVIKALVDLSRERGAPSTLVAGVKRLELDTMSSYVDITF